MDRKLENTYCEKYLVNCTSEKTVIFAWIKMESVSFLGYSK